MPYFINFSHYAHSPFYWNQLENVCVKRVERNKPEEDSLNKEKKVTHIPYLENKDWRVSNPKGKNG